MDYFMTGLFVDLADLHHNARDGVHIASTGGVWNALIYGFGGLRDYHGQLTFDPRLPQEWRGLRFALNVRESRIRVHIKTTDMTVELEKGESVDFTVRGKDFRVREDQPVTVPLDDQGPFLPSLEGRHPVMGDRRADGSVMTASLPESAFGDAVPPQD